MIKSEKDKIYFDGIKLNEGAYFYLYPGQVEENIKSQDIEKCFKSVEDKTSDFKPIAKVLREKINYKGKTNAFSSLLLFSSKVVPSFMQKVEDGYKEKECYIGYALILEIENYIIIFSRHANGIDEFKNKLNPINGSTLTSAIVKADTLFTQLKLGNMSLNPNALRNRSYEGNDLNQSMPLFGLGQSVVKSTRIQQPNADTTTINLNTSRVAKIGSEKKGIIDLCIWANMVITGIKKPIDLSTTMLNNFSKPISWQEERKNLKPIYLLVDIHELLNKIEENEMKLVYIRKKNNEEEIGDLNNILRKHSECFELKEIEKKAHTIIYSCKNLSSLLVKVTKNGIRLDGDGRLSKLYVLNSDGKKNKMTTFINSKKCFYVGFEDVQYIYYGTQLHKDSNMKENLDSILSIFEPVADMKNVKSEKGKLKNDDTQFHQDSIFGVIEDYYKDKNASFLICDDMGNECADHIAICGDTLSFIHSKSGRQLSLSASKFQEVIGQAVKNIGNLRNLNVAEKVNTWRNKKYIKTNISVCRKGEIEQFETEYNRISKSPNGIKEVCLAIDFISKKELKDAFDKIRYGKSLKQKNSVSQMIWLLSAFISTCKDADMHCRIFCQA